MKLFTVGPVEMFEETMAIGGQQVPYFRNEEFSEIVTSCMKKTKGLLNCSDNGEVVVLTCSGTGAMEATLLNCFDEKDHLLVIDGGAFGHRFVTLCEMHSIPHTAVNLGFGEVLTKEKLEKASEGLHLTGLLVNINETSTAQLYDKKLLGDFCKERNILFVADCISTFLADSLDMQEYGMDAIIVSSQKALSLAPGLSFVALSPRMIEERVEKYPVRSMYFDFKSHIENGKRGQTPFTPAVRIIIEWKERLKQIETFGVDAVVENTAKLASNFRKGLEKIGLKYPEYPISNACTPVFFPKENAAEVYCQLIEKYGIVVNPSGGELGEKMFRVAHIGNLTLEDNQRILEALEELLNSDQVK